MKTISLRYTDKIAPNNGTIDAHVQLLKRDGFVWYGKMGPPISDKVTKMLLDNPEPRFLLIHSGSFERYWVFFDAISRETPPFANFPSYYHSSSQHFNTWFRVTRFEEASKTIVSQCFVSSSGAPLSDASRHSMSPYFIIDYIPKE